MWRPDSVFDGSGHLDEGVVHAWLDEALDPGSAREVREHAAACDPCAARVAEARGLVAGASRLLGALDVESGVAPVAAGAPGGADVAPIGRRRRWSTRRVSLAAAAVLVFVAGSVVLRDRFDDGASLRETMDASAPAREASEVGVSAAAPEAGPVEASAPPPPAATGAGIAMQQRTSTPVAAPSAAPAAAPAAAAEPGAVRAVVPRREIPGIAAADAVMPVPAPAPLPAPPQAVEVATVPARPDSLRIANRTRDDSATVAALARRDSAMARLRRGEVALEAVVVTGVAEKAPAAAATLAPRARSAAGDRLRGSTLQGVVGAWVIGCWQVGDTESNLEFTEAALGTGVVGLTGEWHPGARIAAGQWRSIAWRFERDSVVRVQEWAPGRDLLIRPGRDAAEASVVPSAGSPEVRHADERVRLVRRGASCP